VVLEILAHSQFELIPMAVPNAAVSILEPSSLCLVGSVYLWLWPVVVRSPVHIPMECNSRKHCDQNQ
jgi:hypothetical protein